MEIITSERSAYASTTINIDADRTSRNELDKLSRKSQITPGYIRKQPILHT